MTTPIAGVDQVHWMRSENAYDNPIAFAATDGIAFNALELEPSLEFHPSKEKVGTASPQRQIRGKTRGSWNGEVYVAPNGVGIPPDAYEMLRAGMGRMEVDLTVIDVAQGAGATVTAQIGDTTTTLTEGTDFNRGATNLTAAQAIATAINALPDVTATATGTRVLAYSDTRSLVLSSGAPAAWTPTRVGFALRGKGHRPISLQLGKSVGPSFYEQANGAWVEKLEFEAVGNDEPKIRASGGYATHSFLHGEPQTNAAAYAQNATVITLRPQDNGKIAGVLRVQFIRVSDGAVEDNGGTGYQLQAVDMDTGRMTLASGLANALTAEAYRIEPFVPAHAVSGDIQGGIACGLFVDGTEVGFISSKLTLTTGIHGLDKEAHVDRPNRLSRGARALEGEAQFYFLDETAGHLGQAWNGARRSLETRAGEDIPGQRMRIITPNTLLMVSKPDIPEAEEATRSVKHMPEMATQPESELRVEFS